MFNAAWTSSPSQAGNNAEGERAQRMSDEKLAYPLPPRGDAEVLFANETQFYTDDIVRIGNEYYFRHKNGGHGGAWDPRDFHPKVQTIDRKEARRLALEWGQNLDTVAEKLP